MDPDTDVLITRLRERAADASRRADLVPTVFDDEVGGMAHDQLRSSLDSIAGDLGRLVSDIQSGSPIDPAVHERAESVRESMTRSAPRALPLPATDAAVDQAEARLGAPLPALLRRLYLEVADGGFGPHAGLLPVERMAATYAELRSGSPSEVESDEWPEGLLPIVAIDAGHACLAAATGHMHESDFEETVDDGVFGLVIREISPSLHAWLTEWLDEPVSSAVQTTALHSSMVDQARESRARIAAMTPEERAALGLPEHGWERVVWGGLGLEQDDPPDTAA